MSASIAIIGAGISGLVAAIELERHGYSPVLIDKNKEVGGRVRSDLHEKMPLDHGFQVLLTAYPETKKYLNYDNLDLRYFEPGAIIFRKNRGYKFGDGLRKAHFLLPTLFAGIAKIPDKLKMLKLQRWIRKTSIEALFATTEMSTLDYLKSYGFSDKIIEHFFRPFYAGIFLENDLHTSSRMFLFVFKMFAEGYAAVPARGMQAIPTQLADRLQRTDVKLNTAVRSIQDNTITYDDNTKASFDQIIIANSSQRFMESSMRDVKWKACINLYFKAAPGTFGRKIIGLCADPKTLINNLHYLSDLYPGRSSDNLLSVTVIGDPDLDEKDLEDRVRTELSNHCGIRVGECVGIYRIQRALPDLSELSYLPNTGKMSLNQHTVLTGDHVAYGSMNAAMTAGAYAAGIVRSRLEA